MAESQSMTTPEVVAKTLITEHSDFLREAVAIVAAELMESEIGAEIGAGRGERSAERADPPKRLPGRGFGRPGSGRSSWRFPASASGEAATFRASWSRAAPVSRPSSASSWRPTSMASRPARSTAWSSSSVSPR